MSARLRVSLKHGLLLAYLFAVLLLIALLFRDENLKQPPFTLSGAVLGEDPSARTVALHGERFHPGIKGLVTKSLVNEEALLWHRFHGIPFRWLDVRDSLGLFSFDQNRVASLSFSKGGKPVLHDSIVLPGMVNEIRIVGSKALVGLARGEGVSVVDMSDPNELKVVDHYPLSGSVSRIVVEGSSGYFCGIRTGVSRLDLAAKKPVLEKLVDLDAPWRMSMQGNRVAVGTLKGRVHLFEIDQSGAFVEVNVLDFPGQVRGVEFTGEIITIACSDNSLFVYDLSSWPTLTQPGRLFLPGQPFDLKRVPGQERVIVSMASAGLGLVDVRLKTAPILSGWFKVPKTYLDFTVISETILATSNEGLDFISLKEVETGEMARLAPDALIDKGLLKLQSWSQSVYGYNKQELPEVVARAPVKGPSPDPYLPIVDSQSVRIFEPNGKGQLLSVGSVAVEEGALDARFYAGSLHVLYQAGLRVFSLDSSSEWTAVGDFPISGRMRCFELLDSGAVMIATDDQEVFVVDIRDPEEMKQVSRLTLPKSLKALDSQDILIDGSRAYLSLGLGGLYIVDISSMQSPEVLQILDTPGKAGVMALHEGLLFVADRVAGLFVVDVKDHGRALPVGRLEVPVQIIEIEVATDGLIVSSTRGGTLKLPLPQRLQDVQVVSGGEAFVDIASIEKGHYVYLYDEWTSARVALDVN